MRISSTIAALSSLATAGMATAQDWNNLATSEAMNQLHASMRQNMIVAPSEGGTKGRPRKTVSSRTDTAYPANPDIRKRVQHFLVSAAGRNDKAAGEQLATVFAKHDLIAMTDRALAPIGLRSGDVIDAVAIYRLAMWGAANGITTPPHRSMALGVRRQVAATFDLTRAGLQNPAQRQQFAETLLYQAILIDLASEEASKTKDEPVLQKIRASARKALADSGLDTERLQLTAQGFTPRS